jgi:hypothetical protein
MLLDGWDERGKVGCWKRGENGAKVGHVMRKMEEAVCSLISMKLRRGDGDDGSGGVGGDGRIYPTASRYYCT